MKTLPAAVFPLGLFVLTASTAAGTDEDPRRSRRPGSGVLSNTTFFSTGLRPSASPARGTAAPITERYKLIPWDASTSTHGPGPSERFDWTTDYQTHRGMKASPVRKETFDQEIPYTCDICVPVAGVQALEGALQVHLNQEIPSWLSVSDGAGFPFRIEELQQTTFSPEVLYPGSGTTKEQCRSAGLQQGAALAMFKGGKCYLSEESLYQVRFHRAAPNEPSSVFFYSSFSCQVCQSSFWAHQSENANFIDYLSTRGVALQTDVLNILPAFPEYWKEPIGWVAPARYEEAFVQEGLVTAEVLTNQGPRVAPGFTQQGSAWAAQTKNPLYGGPEASGWDCLSRAGSGGTDDECRQEWHVHGCCGDASKCPKCKPTSLFTKWSAAEPSLGSPPTHDPAGPPMLIPPRDGYFCPPIQASAACSHNALVYCDRCVVKCREEVPECVDHICRGTDHVHCNSHQDCACQPQNYRCVRVQGWSASHVALLKDPPPHCRPQLMGAINLFASPPLVKPGTRSFAKFKTPTPETPTYYARDIADLKSMLFNLGPLAVALALRNMLGDAVSLGACLRKAAVETDALPGYTQERRDHLALLVGYRRFAYPDGFEEDQWVLKNSWGVRQSEALRNIYVSSPPYLYVPMRTSAETCPEAEGLDVAGIFATFGAKPHEPDLVFSNPWAREVELLRT